MSALDTGYCRGPNRTYLAAVRWHPGSVEMWRCTHSHGTPKAAVACANAELAALPWSDLLGPITECYGANYGRLYRAINRPAVQPPYTFDLLQERFEQRRWKLADC